MSSLRGFAKLAEFTGVGFAHPIIGIPERKTTNGMITVPTISI
jgi:hypothetical protein